MRAKSVSDDWKRALRFLLVLSFVVLGAFVKTTTVKTATIRADEPASEEAKEETKSELDSPWVDSVDLVGEGALQFRVDNVVSYTKNEREFEFRSSTVFCGDLAFDFVGENGEIVVYSFKSQKYALVDPIRRIRAELDAAEIERFLERVKPILRDKDGFAAFMVEPSFEVSEKENELFFQSKWIDYHIDTSAFEDEQIADAYFKFVDALGKLNVYMNPGAVTPLARVETNATLAKASRFPAKVVADIYPKGKTIFTRAVQIRNESSIARRLSQRDRNRVHRAIHFIAQFPLVPFQTYFEKTTTEQ